jgi:hypothetical protein
MGVALWHGNVGYPRPRQRREDNIKRDIKEAG